MENLFNLCNLWENIKKLLVDNAVGATEREKEKTHKKERGLLDWSNPLLYCFNSKRLSVFFDCQFTTIVTAFWAYCVVDVHCTTV